MVTSGIFSHYRDQRLKEGKPNAECARPKPELNRSAMAQASQRCSCEVNEVKRG